MHYLNLAPNRFFSRQHIGLTIIAVDPFFFFETHSLLKSTVNLMHILHHGENEIFRRLSVPQSQPLAQFVA